MTNRDNTAVWEAELRDMPEEVILAYLRRRGYNVSDKPREWHTYHHQDCGTRYRGCAPSCPADVYERTGVWIGPAGVALPAGEERRA